jgi:hypothetical protein
MQKKKKKGGVGVEGAPGGEAGEGLGCRPLNCAQGGGSDPAE